MSGGHTQATTVQRYNGMQIGSSSYGGAVPILYGRQRVTFTLIWYDNFKSTPVKQSGGKGGGGQQNSSYNYSSSWAAALVEGPIQDIVTVWQDKDVSSLSAQGLTLFTGTGGQAVWSYLTTNFPGAAIPYDHTCYVGAINYNLGGSAALPNLTFEVDGLLVNPTQNITFSGSISAGATSANLASPWPNATGQWSVTFSDYETFFCNFTSGSTAVSFTSPLQQNVTNTAYILGSFDSDPAQFLPDYITDQNHGMSRPTSFLASTTGTNSYQTYIRALNFYLSPYENTQRQASDFVSEILKITNSDTVWTGSGQLRIVPYADQPVSGNGVTYTPNTTPLFSFGPDDYIVSAGEPPVRLTRKSVANTYNHIKVEYLDRSNSYNTAIAEATDMNDINLNGERVMDTLSYHEITNASTARLVAQLILQTVLYERNTVTFTVRGDYGSLEPMDYVEVSDVGLVYNQQLFRCTKVTNHPDHTVEIEALEIPGSVRTAPLYQWQAVQGYNANYAVAPGSVPTPVFMEANGTIVDPTGGRELYIGVCGPNGGTNWGGCQVWMSFDNVTYSQIGTITSQAAIGTLNAALPAGTSDPDSNVLQINLTNDSLTMTSGTTADADNNRILMAIDPYSNGGANLEILSYASVSLVSPGNYNVTYLHRGQYGSKNILHPAGVPFMLLNQDTFVLPLDPGWIGQTMYFKFPSYNIVGRATESLAAVTAYQFTPVQGAIAYNSSSQSTFSSLGNGVMYSPTTAFKRPNGSGGWDSSVYSVEGYTNGCAAECYPSQTNLAFMLGLTTNPTASPSYTNLPYAWYPDTAGNLEIYESGNYQGTYGSYTASDLLAITHDGKHVVYWHNGVPVRSVPVGNNTFYMQLAFASDNAAAYGISFGSNIASTAPFTLVPMSNNVTCYGTTARPNNQNTNGVWGQRTYQSKESYTTGCQISFSVTAPQDAQTLGLSNIPTAGGAGPQQYMSAGWYAWNPGGGWFVIFNQNQQGQVYPGTGPGGTPGPNDVATVTYDQFWFRWWLNGALVHQEYYPNAGALYAFGDFYDPSAFFTGETTRNISFGPYGASTPNPFIATGACVTHDSTAQKVGVGPGFDSCVYSLNSYSTCHLQAKANTNVPNGGMVIGFAGATPATAPANPDYGWLLGAGGVAQVRIGGSIVLQLPNAYLATDLFSMVYDGSQINWYYNGAITYSHYDAGRTFFFSSLFYDSGINSLSFGPGITLDLIPTAGMDANAASQMVSAYAAGPIAPPAATNGAPSVATIGSLNINTTGSPVAVDVSLGIVQLFNALGTTAWNMQITVLRDGQPITGSPTATWDSSTIPWTPNAYVPAQPVAFTFVDASVPSGRHSYAVVMTLSKSGAGVTQMSWGQESIKLREIKR